MGRKSKSEDITTLDPHSQMAAFGMNRGVRPPGAPQFGTVLPPALHQLASRIYVKGSTPVAI